MKSTQNAELTLMSHLVNNLSEQSNLPNKGKIQLLTLCTLKILFDLDSDSYGLMFEEHNGIHYLEELQYSPHKSIYDLVSNIIETYFGVEEEDTETYQKGSATVNEEA